MVRERSFMATAFSSEVGTGSRQENASNERTLQDGAENPEPVAPGVELAEGTLRARIIRRFDLRHRQRQFERVHAQFGLDLETVRQHRKGLYETAREHAVAGQNVLERHAEHRG